MTGVENLTKDNFETVYKIYHEVEYGFGGNTSIWVAVENETEDRIEGRRFGPMSDWPHAKIVVQKDSVAGWEEDRRQYRKIPEEAPSPSAEDLQRAYINGHLDENELEERLEEVEL